MDITWLGHSSFRIKGKSATLVTDPYDSSIGFKFPKVEANIVTVTHNHGDHNNTSGVLGDPKVVNGPGEYEISNVSIFGISTFHDDKEGAQRGRNTVYTILMDNIKLCHLGDLGHKLTQEQLEEIGNIDILFVPTGGHYTIGPSEAIEIISSIEPKVVMPMHYKEAGMGATYDDLEGVEAFIKELGAEPLKMEKYQVTSDKLPEERQIVLLERKN